MTRKNQGQIEWQLQKQVIIFYVKHNLIQNRLMLKSSIDWNKLSVSLCSPVGSMTALSLYRNSSSYIPVISGIAVVKYVILSTFFSIISSPNVSFSGWKACYQVHWIHIDSSYIHIGCRLGFMWHQNLNAVPILIVLQLCNTGTNTGYAIHRFIGTILLLCKKT